MSKLFFERFEGTSGADEETWTSQSVGAGCTIDKVAAASVPNGAHMGWGEYSIRLIRASTGWDARKWVNLDTTTTRWYVHVEILVDSEGLADAEQVPLIALTRSAGGVAAQLELRQASGALNFRWRAREAGSGGGLTDYDSAEISLDTVYSLDLLYDIEEALHQARLDNTVFGENDGITPDDDMKQLLIGAGTGATQSATTVFYDRISVGTDRWYHLDGPNAGEITTLSFTNALLETRYKKGTARLTKAVGITPDEFTCELRAGGNRIENSNDFDPATPTAWELTNASLNATTPTAVLVEDSSNDVHHIQQDDRVIVPGGVHMLSADVEAGSGADRDIDIRLIDQTTGDAFGVVFDTSARAVSLTFSTGNGQVVDSGVVPGVNLDDRVWVTGRLTQSSTGESVRTRVHIRHPSSGISYQGDGSANVQISRPNLEHRAGIDGNHYVRTFGTPYRTQPSALARVSVGVSWTESDGAIYYDTEETLFVGTVVGVEINDAGVNRANNLKVRCLGNAWQLAQQRFTYVTNEDTADQVASDIISDNSLPLSYTSTGNDTMPTVASRGYIDKTIPEMLEDVSRRAPAIWKVMPDINVEIWQVGDRIAVVDFDRDIGMHLLANPVVSIREDEIANRVKVIGRDGLLVIREDSTSQSTYGTYDAQPATFGDIISETDLEQIGDAILASYKDPVIDGRGLKTYWHRIEPGDRTYYTDRVKGETTDSLVREPINIRAVTMEQDTSEVWTQTLDVTTQSLVDVVTPLVERQRAEITEEDEKIIIEAPNTIGTPNDADPAVAADTFQIHFRYDSGGPTWYMELVNGDWTPDLISVVSFSILVPGRSAQTITATASDVAAEGKDLIVTDNNTRRILVQQGDTSGKRVWWQVGDATQDTVELTWADATVLAQGIVQILIGPGDPQLEQISRITYGDETLAANIGVGKLIEIRLPLAP